MPEDPPAGHNGGPHTLAFVAVINAMLFGVGTLYATTGSALMTSIGAGLTVVTAGFHVFATTRQTAAEDGGDASAARREAPGPGESESPQMKERQAFDDFFAHEYPKLVGLLLRNGATYTNAKEAAADAMGVVFEKWDQIEQPIAYARKVALRQLGRPRREELGRGEDDLFNAATFGAFDFEAEIGIHDEADKVMRHLRALPRVQSEVMALTVDGHTTAEIAEILDKDEATVRSNLRHARRALKARLEKEGLL